MTDILKYARESLVIQYEDGFCPEAWDTDFNAEWTVDDVLRQVDDMHRVTRIVIIGSALKDITKAVSSKWLEDRDLVEHDETFGCPAFMNQREWDALVDEQATEDFNAKYHRDSMEYHHGRNWAGLAGAR